MILQVLLLLSLVALSTAENRMLMPKARPSSSSSMRLGGARRNGRGRRRRTYRITVTNLTLEQPMSPFFAAVHSGNGPVLYEMGEPASAPLALLAENGMAQPLVDSFSMSKQVENAMIATDGPVFPGQTATFEVTTTRDARFFSMASMAIHTNDCFVGVSGVRLQDDMTMMLPGLDAGSEENNELCTSIPGPDCGDTGNVPSGNGEGFVHVHRGFFGIGGTLARDIYDWRNPMLLLQVERI